MGKCYDVFVSHNSQDVNAAAQLTARILKRTGLTTYFSPIEMEGGDAWQNEIERAIEQSRSMIVLVGGHGLGQWQTEEVAAALSRQKRHPSFRVIPVLLPGSETNTSSSLPLFLRNRHSIDFRAGVDDEDGLLALIRGIRIGFDTKPSRPTMKKLWYFDDNEERLQMFSDNHRNHFDITSFSSAMDMIEMAGRLHPGDSDWPDAVLVDMYAPIDAPQAAIARREADKNLLEFMRLERELRAFVDAAWRPYGAHVVSIVRRTYSASELPIAIYTQRGLVLLEDKIVSDLEWLGVQWVIKDRFSAETERLMFNNIIASGKHASTMGMRRILYLEDGLRFQKRFTERHSQNYQIELLSDQGDVLPALERERGTRDWPDLLLVDLYYPKDTSEGGRGAIDFANSKLREFHDFEDQFRQLVRRAYEPLGLTIVNQLRRMHGPDELPIIIHTQTGLLLLEEESIRQLEEYGTGWLLKDRHEQKTEEIKILAHILRSRRTRVPA